MRIIDIYMQIQLMVNVLPFLQPLFTQREYISTAQAPTEPESSAGIESKIIGTYEGPTEFPSFTITYFLKIPWRRH